MENKTKLSASGIPIASVVVASSGKKYPLSGAQPIENVKALIETALKAQ